MTDSFVHPVISIITPARNQERYIQEMLRSIQVQSFQQWECIVVDDASTDAQRMQSILCMIQEFV
ncbi:MAG TPA: glycosyltransferase [Candidatus Hydrogenedentes bacterium]|nr:glycosyltransferase [Candidatus Hydrogenedentota bacterium]